MMISKKVAIIAGTMARAEDLRRELGVDAYTWSTHSSLPGRGHKLDTILVDGTSKWSQEIQASLRPTGARIYWIEPVML